MAVERKKERKKEKKRKEKKSMIIVVPSCLKDADGARTRSDQKIPLAPLAPRFVQA
jgi:hypothetical protein